MNDHSVLHANRNRGFDWKTAFSAGHRWLARTVALLLAGMAAAGHAQTSSPAVPRPQYSITDNGLGFYGPRFNAPQEAAAYIAAEHLKVDWLAGSGLTLHCPASPAAFTSSEFTAST